MLDPTFRGAYKIVNAAWNYLKIQKHGRILCTSTVVEKEYTCSPSYAAAKYGQLGFIQTLAKEGAKYDILASVLAPAGYAGSAPGVPASEVEVVAQVVAALVHRSNTTETGHLYEIEGGRLRKVRWQRASGAFLNPDAGLTAGAILSKWNDVNDFSQGTYPNNTSDHASNYRKAIALAPSPTDNSVRLDGKTALVTGAGNGLGRAYAKLFASLGAQVIVNDLKGSEEVAEAIRQVGGDAHAVPGSVEEGERIVEVAIAKYGRLDIVVNNAGFVRDKSIANMTDDLWDAIIAVHLKGMFRVTKAAWPYMVKQCYGRILNVSSTSGMYGNFGQSNYSTAKCAVLGFSEALAREGAKHNIAVNAMCPFGSTPGLVGSVSGDWDNFHPEQCAPFVALISSDALRFSSTSAFFELGVGWHGRTRQQKSSGAQVPREEELASGSASKFLKQVADFTNLIYSEEMPGALQETVGLLSQSAVLARIKDAKRRTISGTTYEYGDREVILYNLTLGATWRELPLIHERERNFQVLPTFGVVPFFNTKLPFNYDELLPKWNLANLLHGEHYLEIRKFPIPTAAKLVTYPRLLEVLDKNKAAIIVTGYTTRDAETGEDIFYNEVAAFVREAGGFGGQKSTKSRHRASTALAPSRKADVVRSERTTEEHAALYRLNGDRNAMHVDLAKARSVGFSRPILHGLCFFGISGKHIYQEFGPIRNIRARFASTVYPGQTLRTEMWREGDTILFQTSVVETGKICINGGRAELLREKYRGRL
ncbi:hypothetical protein CLAIMM_06733 isoform 2 [Cladophialophora immunda]|nr:hypothetical protein CLAIMM_06733 isoform 2 [Cladophialophora immunda]